MDDTYLQRGKNTYNAHLLLRFLYSNSIKLSFSALVGRVFKALEGVGEVEGGGGVGCACRGITAALKAGRPL